MLAELDHIHCSRARWRFALGCVRAVLMRPPLLTLFIVAASLLMGALVTIQVAGGRLDVTSKAWQMATMFDFAVFAGVALVLSADGSPHRAATRRLCTASGVVIGGFLYIPAASDPRHGPRRVRWCRPVRRRTGATYPVGSGRSGRMDRAFRFGGDAHLTVGGAGRRPRLHERADRSVGHHGSVPERLAGIRWMTCHLLVKPASTFNTRAPLPNRCGVQWVVTVRVEPQAPTEASVANQLVAGRALDQFYEAPVSFVQELSYVCKRKVALLLCHLSVERVDAAVGCVPRWPASSKNYRQVLEGLILPGVDVRDDVLDRPVACHTGLEEPCIEQTRIRLLERDPGRVEPGQHPFGRWFHVSNDRAAAALSDPASAVASSEAPSVVTIGSRGVSRTIRIGLSKRR